MCNLSWTPHYSLEKDNSLNHSCVSQKIGCLEYLIKKKVETSIVSYLMSVGTVQFHFRNSDHSPVCSEGGCCVRPCYGHF